MPQPRPPRRGVDKRVVEPLRVRELIGDDDFSGRQMSRTAASKLYRQIVNSPTTLAGLGVGLAKGATFGPGLGGTIEARLPKGDYSDPQTLGDTMIIPEHYTGNLPVRVHELGHASQGRYAGPFLPAASGVAVATQGYDKSMFEGENAMQAGEEELRRMGLMRLLTGGDKAKTEDILRALSNYE